MRKRKMYLSVEDIAELFGLSVSFAYRVVERMNADLASNTISTMWWIITILILALERKRIFSGLWRLCTKEECTL